MTFEEDAIEEALSEAIWECERESRTSLWRSFWDRLTGGEYIPTEPDNRKDGA